MTGAEVMAAIQVAASLTVLIRNLFEGVKYVQNQLYPQKEADIASSLSIKIINHNNIIKEEKNSPFDEPVEDKIPELKDIYYKSNNDLLLLVAPFYDDKLPYPDNDKGGYPNFLSTIDRIYQSNPIDGIEKCSGYLKRPLYKRDNDRNTITSALAGIPVILIHGIIENKQQVCPMITAWNLLPDDNRSFQIKLKTFQVDQCLLDNIKFQDQVAIYLHKYVRLLNDIRQLILNGKRPNLTNYVIENDNNEEFELIVQMIGQCYDQLRQHNPNQKYFYFLEQAIMLYESGLEEKSSEQLNKAWESWCGLKSIKELNDIQTNVLQVFNKSDHIFLKELNKIYRLIGTDKKIKEWLEMMSEKSDIQQLQEGVIRLLENASELMQEVQQIFLAEPLKDEHASDQYKDYGEQIKSEIEKVQNLELIMAIAAPMSAGKSTIINAIVGQELLPSRNTATTTLPTRVCLKLDNEKPILYLDANTVALFKETIQKLQSSIERSGGLEKVKHEKLQSYSHLWEVVDKINNGEAVYDITQKTFGKEQIHNTLGILNDLIRLCILLEPILNPLLKLRNIPQIETPFPPFPKAQVNLPSNLIGNLVIVDTPGPSESMKYNLLDIVRKQLRQSSIVLFVLDFTQLKTRATDEIKEEVEQIIKLRGKDNLYILVNKVDERTKDKYSLTSEQVQDFVRGELDVTDTDHLFEVAARLAFQVRNCYKKQSLETTKTKYHIDISDKNAIEWLLKEAYGKMFKIEIAKFEKQDEELREEQIALIANTLWDESGFKPFIEQAIIALMQEIAPRCIDSALNHCYNVLVELKNDLSLRLGTLEADIKDIKEQISKLQSDLDELKKRQDESMTQIPIELEQLDSSIYRRFKNIQSNTQNHLKTKLDVTWVNKILDFFGINDEEFSTHDEAKAYANQKGLAILNYAENNVKTSLSGIEKDLQDSHDKLRELVKKGTQDILEKAQERLGKTFDQKLTLPEIRLPSIELEDYFNTFSDSKVDTKLKREVTYTKLRSERKRTWWSLWLIESEVVIEEPIYEKRTKYVIKRTTLIQWANKSISDAIRKAKEGVKSYVKDEFEDHVNGYYNQIKRYLSGYQGNLIDAKRNRQRSSEEKAKIKEILEGLKPKVIKQLESLKECREHNQEFLN